MSVRTVIIAGILGLVVIEICALYYERDTIEKVLRDATRKTLAEHDTEVSADQVFFSGRDAYLQGQVSTLEEKRRVEQIMLQVWDVRVVHNQLRVSGRRSAEDMPFTEEEIRYLLRKPAPMNVAFEPRFNLTHQGDKSIQVQGVLSDSVMQGRVMDMVRSSFPGYTLENQLLVDGELMRPGWYESLLSLMPTVALVNKPSLFVLSDDGAFELTGEVFGNVQRDVIIEDAVKALGDSIKFQPNLVTAETDESEEDVRVATLKARIQNLVATTRIQFLLNTADLLAESLEVLNEIAELLNEAPDIQVEIQGHTDNTGSSALNIALSQTRAETVQAYLIDRGVDASRLTAVGYGPARPIATNFTYEGRVTNRRVEFSLKGGS